MTMLYNIIMILALSGLSAYLDKWWIILFSLFLLLEDNYIPINHYEEDIKDEGEKK